MSSRAGLAATVEGGIQGCAVLPAAPDNAQPGAGQGSAMQLPLAKSGVDHATATSACTVNALR